MTGPCLDSTCFGYATDFFGSAVTTLTPSQPIMFFDIQYIYLSIYKVFLEPLPTHILTRLLKRSRWHDRALRWHRISSWRVGDSDPGEAAGISRGSRHVAELRTMFEIDKITKCVGLQSDITFYCMICHWLVKKKHNHWIAWWRDSTKFCLSVSMVITQKAYQLNII